MRRLGAGAALAVLGLWLAAGAAAHPLGNFSVNHLDQVRISSGRVSVRYILDQAEIPTFEERGLTPAAVLAAKQAEVARGLSLTVDGRRVPLTGQPGAVVSHPPGQGGLPLTRVELALVAAVPARASLAISDQTFPGRVGWKAIVVAAGQGTAVGSSAPTGDPTGGLRHYPTDLLSSPLDQRTATFTVAPGGGTVLAPRSPGGAQATTTNRAGDGFAGVFSDAASGKGVLLVLLLAAFGWGAVHALSPGHGKGMVAAYLVGSRGTPRHALALGLTVTVTHTVGVFALGAVTLLLSRYVLPEQLYPWLNLVAGLLVLVIGAAVLRSRIRRRRP
ncbi:MAG: nickel/cobalt transporter (NicO) family protein, partial [Solirubrobacteraceae bacterium]|nr:nickel/cobalt transporter (NicO) family protein [Solirubrobacteraceae bacterium]